MPLSISQSKRAPPQYHAVRVHSVEEVTTGTKDPQDLYKANIKDGA